ncbi:MAG: MFS transporter [Puniceicoccales bacterium]|jgi:MFS family permease|nr:MFS transporter [Puniceicoccales bacterium]
MKRFHKLQRQDIAWLVWMAAVIFYFYEFFVRVAPGSMFKDMQHSYGVTAGLFGFASGIYYAIYSFVQVIAGILFDRFGGRKILIPACLCVTFGCACVLLSPQSLWVFAIGRFFMGLGSGFGFIGVMYLAAVWFRQERLSLISGLTTAMGFLGAILTIRHIPQLVERIGWIPCWLWASILGALSTVILYIAVPHSPAWEINRRETYGRECTQHRFLTGLFQVLRNPQTWIIGCIAGSLYATPTVFGDLWGNAYLQTVANLSHSSAGRTVATLYIGWLLGSPFFGWLSDRIKKKKIFLQLSSLACGLLLCLFLYCPLSLNATRIALLLIGFLGSPQVICFTASLETNPPSMSGSAIAIVNMIVTLIGGLMQPLVGWLIDCLTRIDMGNNLPTATAHNFRIALGVLPIVTFAGFIMTFFYNENRKGIPS